MKWEIIGVDRETGEGRRLVCDAINVASAEKQGRDAGLFIESITEVAATASASATRESHILIPRKVLVAGIIAVAASVLLISVGALLYAYFGYRQTKNAPHAVLAQLRAGVIPITERASGQTKSSGSIHGAAWVQRESGSSDLQRGMSVELIADEVNPEKIAKCLEETAKDWDDSGSHARKIANDYKKEFPSQDIWRRYDVEADEDAHEAANLREMIKHLKPEKMKTGAAFAMIEGLGPFRSTFASNLFSSAVAETHTDADGKYAFMAVMPGNYCVHSRLFSNSSRIEWCVPVKVSAGDDEKVDLFNDNAALIRN